MKTILPFVMISTFLLLHASATEQTGDEAKQTEIRKSLASEDPAFRIVKSPDGEAYFPPGKESYYTQYYQAAKLPSMQFKREEKGKVRFRLAILPSFTKPLFLTYSRGANGAVIEITRLNLRSANNSLEPGDVELSGKVAVGSRIARRLEADAIDPSVRKPLGSLTDEQRQIYQGMDGCTWILEVATETDYTMEDVWSPESIGNMDPKILEKFKVPKVDTKWFIDFCDTLLKISDMKVPDCSITELLDNS
jgi:hypothetical protein